MSMERRGILSVEPSHALLPESPSAMETALSTAKGIYDVMGKHYENKYKGAQARNENLAANLKQGTLASDILATNTKNQTDTQYYPQMQAAKLQQEHATIQEIMARTGLSYAQAREAGARIGLIGAETRKANLGPNGELLNAYNNAPNGSSQKAYYGALLNKEMGAYAPGMSGGMGGGSVPGTPKGGPVPMSAPGSIENNPLGGGGRSTFHQAFDPATGQTLESPTQASATRNQMRTEANSEMDSVEPQLKKGFSPYLGAGGTAKLAYDGILARNQPNTKAGKEAAQRLLDYNVANKLKVEVSNMISRQSAGQAPGVEASKHQQESTFGDLPFNAGNYLTPRNILENAYDKYYPQQKALANAAVNQERQGYQQGGDQPPWAGQEGGSRGGFGANGYEAPQAPKQQIAGGFNGNPNITPEAQHPQQFGSREDAMTYYNSLSPKQKAAYLASLPEK